MANRSLPSAALEGEAIVPCANCGGPLALMFCPHCGEERPDSERLRASHVAHTAIAELVDFEHSKLLATLRGLFFKPGSLTAAYIAGARRRHLGPIKLFIFAFAASLTVYSILPRTNSYDIHTMVKTDRSGTYQGLVDKIAGHRKVPAESVLSDINQRWHRYLSFGEMGYPLAVAIALAIVYFGRRRYFGEHLIFGFHYVSFSLIAAIVLWPLFYLTGVNLTRAFSFAAGVSALIGGIYLVLALRRVYGDRWVPAFFRAIFVLAAYYFGASVVIMISLALAFILSS